MGFAGVEGAGWIGGREPILAPGAEPILWAAVVRRRAVRKLPRQRLRHGLSIVADALSPREERLAAVREARRAVRHGCQGIDDGLADMVCLARCRAAAVVDTHAVDRAFSVMGGKQVMGARLRIALPIACLIAATRRLAGFARLPRSLVGRVLRRRHGFEPAFAEPQLVVLARERDLLAGDHL